MYWTQLQYSRHSGTHGNNFSAICSRLREVQGKPWQVKIHTATKTGRLKPGWRKQNEDRRLRFLLRLFYCESLARERSKEQYGSESVDSLNTEAV